MQTTASTLPVTTQQAWAAKQQTAKRQCSLLIAQVMEVKR